jgi:5-methylcytosine-specific restriction endonuclease McrA
MTRPGDPRSTAAWRRLRKQVLAQESDCWICGRPVDFQAKPWMPWAPNADHIIPVELAPHLALERSSARLAHRACNSTKRSRMPDPPDLSAIDSNGARQPSHCHNHSRIWTEGHALRDCPACIADCDICGRRR